MTKRILACFIFIAFPALSRAVPIDWHGTFGVDTTLLSHYNGLDGGHAIGERGSQAAPLAEGSEDSASWQSYLFKLSPVIIVNDSATIKGEISSGYAKGGFLGDGMSQSKTPGMGNALYPHNFSDSNNALVLNKFFVELYADTATYRIGRHDSHFGLGAVVNAGTKNWDRFSSVRDGITLDVKLGNFFISPYWAQISSSDSLSGASNVKEYGIKLNYKNVAKDVSFGILYNTKTNANFHSMMKSAIREPICHNTENEKIDCDDIVNVDKKQDLFPVKGTDVTITDFYFQKKMRDFRLALEIPLISGSLGQLFNDDNSVNYNARAIILESSYQFSPKWSLHLNAGHVTGDSGDSGQFEAMYLHPNYQIANLLFRYNLLAVSDNNLNVHDSYLTNTRYLKLEGEYAAQKWTWNWSLIKAWALTSAQKGQRSFNHLTNRRFDVHDDIQNQSDDLGLEFDVDFDYRWNSAISINGSFGYLFAGDYWKFTNDPDTENSTKNSYALQLQAAINF